MKTAPNPLPLIPDLDPMGDQEWQELLLKAMKRLLAKDSSSKDRFFARWLIDQWNRQHPSQRV